ncbi:energy transducer TonB [Trinickia symbiotica]|uniref:Energy transducer TonB n=2 Tax=Trinickia symbiotica TaxID=863227 RepID=A0A2T3XKI8_9BURK|nr:energy transducer TonB [Trinickia symbiotica]
MPVPKSAAPVPPRTPETVQQPPPPPKPAASQRSAEAADALSSTSAPSPSATERPTAGRSDALASGPARLIAQPLPELPDDMREEGYQFVAIARFVIHADGTFDVELIKATPNARLNQILMTTLHEWRFVPATEAGHPVESHQDVRVHFNVD